MKPRRVPSGRLSSPRPESERRRLLLLGPDKMADVELLALILGGDKPIERALVLLRDAGGLRGLDLTPAQRLARMGGVGASGAVAIAAAVELGRRVAGLPTPYGRTIAGPGDVAGFLRASLGAAPQEHFLVLGLDVRQRLRMIRTIAIGSLCCVNVHPREVFRPLVVAGMHAAILVHNHPSGEAEPSDADITLTHRMAEVGRVLGVPVLDHVVVTRDAMVSMAEDGHAPLVGWEEAVGSRSTKGEP